MSSAVSTKRRVVVVTGGANGIGEAICREFVHSEHAIVVCGDLDQKKGDALAAQFDADSFVFVQVDCGKREDCERLVETAVENFGGLDVLVNNVGVQFDDGTPVHQLEESVWDKVRYQFKFIFGAASTRLSICSTVAGGCDCHAASVRLQSQPGIPHMPAPRALFCP